MDVPITQRELDLLLKGLRELIPRMSAVGALPDELAEVVHLIKRLEQINQPPQRSGVHVHKTFPDGRHGRHAEGHV